MADPAVRAYVGAVVGCAPASVTSVARFEHGNRHAVYRVDYLDASERAQSVVVRVCHSAAAEEVERAEREAAVLAAVPSGVAPELYDFRRRSEWFDAPAMCMAFVPGDDADLGSVRPGRIGALAALVARVHELPLGTLAGALGPPGTVAAYADERLRAILATMAWATDPLPSGLQARLRRASALVADSFERLRVSEAFAGADGLCLLHGDIAPGNLLWSPRPCLIDWEYTRLGDPADELAYTFDQNALTPEQRQAFWDGYLGTGHSSEQQSIQARVQWWEPVTLLGSALWWVERWVRRTEHDSAGTSDPAVSRSPDYYLGHVVPRVHRLEALLREPSNR